MLAGVAALIGTPVIYRIRAASAHARATRSWFWPTWWMLVPLLVVAIGVLVTYLPATFDLRRSVRRSMRRRR